MEQAEAAAHAVQRVVRVVVREAVGVADRTAAQGERHPVTGAPEIVLADVGAEDGAGGVGVTHVGADGAGGLLFHFVFHVDQVLGVGDPLGVRLHGAEVAETLQALAGQVDQRGVGRRVLELTHFTTQHFVFGLGVAYEAQAAHVNAAARVDEERHVHGVAVAGFLLHAAHLGEGVALVAETALDQVTGVGHQLLAEHLAFLQHQQGGQLAFIHHQVAGQLDVVDAELVALGHVDGDQHPLPVRGDRHLGGFDREVDIAAIQVIGTQTFQITGQTLAGILVVALDERPEVRGTELEVLQQLFVTEHGVADHVDVADARGLAFVNLDVQRHPVTRQRHHLGADVGAVAALGDVLALQLPGDRLQRGALEHLALRQARLGEALAQVLLLDLLVTVQIDARDAGALGHHHHQLVAVAAELHVFVVAGGEQPLDRLHHVVPVDGVTGLDRQLRVHALHRDALQPLDADIAHLEGQGATAALRADGHRREDKNQGQGPAEQGFSGVSEIHENCRTRSL